MAWVDFIICLFLGCFGVHKFLEKKFVMGILYLFTVGLFCIGWIYDCIRYFIAAIRGERILGKKEPAQVLPKQLSDDEPLPIIDSPNVLLSQNETCHFCDIATFVKTKNVVVGYSGGNSGVSIRVMKGMSYRVGSSKAQPIRKNIQEKTPGILTITNKRIIFSGNKGAFDKKISSLSSLTAYQNGLAFQFGEKQYPLILDEPTYVGQILTRIINTSDF